MEKKLRKQRSMAELLRQTSKMDKPQMTMVLEGRAQMQGPLDASSETEELRVCGDCRNVIDGSNGIRCGSCGRSYHSLCLEPQIDVVGLERKRYCYNCQVKVGNTSRKDPQGPIKFVKPNLATEDVLEFALNDQVLPIKKVEEVKFAVEFISKDETLMGDSSKTQSHQKRPLSDDTERNPVHENATPDQFKEDEEKEDKKTKKAKPTSKPDMDYQNEGLNGGGPVDKGLSVLLTLEKIEPNSDFNPLERLRKNNSFSEAEDSTLKRMDMKTSGNYSSGSMPPFDILTLKTENDLKMSIELNANVGIQKNTENGTDDTTDNSDLVVKSIAQEVANEDSDPKEAVELSDTIASRMSVDEEEEDVKICDVCGDTGYEDMLAICSNCNEGAEHTYCMQVLLDQVPEYWVCVVCKDKQKETGWKHSETFSRNLSLQSNTSTSHLANTKKPIFGSTRSRLSARLDKRRRSLVGLERRHPLKSSSAQILGTKQLSSDTSAVINKRPDVKMPLMATTKRLIDDITSVSPRKGDLSETPPRKSTGNLSLHTSKKTLDYTHNGSALKCQAAKNLLKSWKVEGMPKSPILSREVVTKNPDMGNSNSLPFKATKIGERTSLAPNSCVFKEEETKISSNNPKARPIITESSSSFMLSRGGEKDHKGKEYEHSAPACVTKSSLVDVNPDISLPSCKLSSTNDMLSLKKPSKGFSNITSGEKSKSEIASAIPSNPTCFAIVETRSKDEAPCVKSNPTEIVEQVSSTSTVTNPSPTPDPLAVRELVSTQQYLIGSDINSSICHSLSQGISPILPLNIVCTQVVTSATAIDDRSEQKTDKINPLPYQNIPKLDGPEKPSNARMDLCHLWRGSFNIKWEGSRCNVIDGIEAFPSSQAVRKVHEVTKRFQSSLELEGLPRSIQCNSWPTHFLKCPPDDQSIALYFLPREKESYERSYKPLVDRMVKHDLALKGHVEAAELLIFPSNWLPENSRSWNPFTFLWAVFRDKKCTRQGHGKLTHGMTTLKTLLPLPTALGDIHVEDTTRLSSPEKMGKTTGKYNTDMEMPASLLVSQADVHSEAESSGQIHARDQLLPSPIRHQLSPSPRLTDNRERERERTSTQGHSHERARDRESLRERSLKERGREHERERDRDNMEKERGKERLREREWPRHWDQSRGFGPQREDKREVRRVHGRSSYRADADMEQKKGGRYEEGCEKRPRSYSPATSDDNKYPFNHRSRSFSDSLNSDQQCSLSNQASYTMEKSSSDVFLLSSEPRATYERASESKGSRESLMDNTRPCSSSKVEHCASQEEQSLQMPKKPKAIFVPDLNEAPLEAEMEAQQEPESSYQVFITTTKTSKSTCLEPDKTSDASTSEIAPSLELALGSKEKHLLAKEGGFFPTSISYSSSEGHQDVDLLLPLSEVKTETSTISGNVNRSNRSVVDKPLRLFGSFL